jgi:hypothetical protein
LIQPVTTWAVSLGRLQVWRDRALVAEYPSHDFPALIGHLSRALQHPGQIIQLWQNGQAVARLPGCNAARLIRAMADELDRPAVGADDPTVPLG